MPNYLTRPNDVRELLIVGKPAYSFGSFDSHNPGSRMQVTGVSLTSNVATLNVTLLEGPAPIVGALASVQGTQNTGGEFNVANAPITAVTGFTTAPLFNAGTIAFALSHADIVAAADSGLAIAATPEVAETLVENTSKRQFVVPRTNEDVGGRTVTWQTDFATCAGAEEPDDVVVNLEGSAFDIEGQYAILDTSASVSGETRYVEGVTLPFLRLTIGSVTGTAKGTGKILI